MKTLNLVYPAVDGSILDSHSVAVEFSLQNKVLTARFDVTCPAITANPALSGNDSQWGLWDWDVVELFLAPFRPTDGQFPCYLEFQVSPLNQYFEMMIFEPRKRFDRDFRLLGLRHSASILSEKRWTAELQIPLAPLGWDGDPGSLFGNAFSIQGKPGERNYWSLYLPPQTKPDFHLPRHFQPLL